MNMCKEVKEDIKSRNIISPWRNIIEFRDMCQWIYGRSSNCSSRQRAMEHLSTWINRRRSQCPAAVYATHAMLEVKLADSCSNLIEDKLKSLYAFALVRFFNFMSSTIQTHNMRSMYTTAIELGLESFVVDIRHICAHSTDLPELSILQQTADYCLNWLHDYYWRPQSEKMSDTDVSCLKKRDKILEKRTKEIKHLFELYDIILECYLNHYETLRAVRKNIRGRRLAVIKEFWNKKNLGTIHEAFDIIVLDMVAIMKSGVCRRHLSVIFAREFMKMKYFFAVVETHNAGIELEELIDVVQNLFRFLAVYNIIENVLSRLFEIVESKADLIHTKRSNAGFWASRIVEGFQIFIHCKKMFKVSFTEDTKTKLDYIALNFKDFSKNVLHAYVYSGVNMKRSLIFGDSFQRPWVWHFNRDYLKKRVKAVNKYTAPILPSLFALVKPKMSDNNIIKLEQLIQVYLKKNSNDGDRVNELEKMQNIKDEMCTLKETLTTIRHSIESGDKNTDDIKPLNVNGWTSVKHDDYKWSKCPIGCLPWE